MTMRVGASSFTSSVASGASPLMSNRQQVTAPPARIAHPRSSWTASVVASVMPGTQNLLPAYQQWIRPPSVMAHADVSSPAAAVTGGPG